MLIYWAFTWQGKGGIVTVTKPAKSSGSRAKDIFVVFDTFGTIVALYIG